VNDAQVDSGAEYNGSDVTYLSGYGDWINVQPYGRVWQPWVTPGWAPFDYGHWAWSDPDWAWVSYEPYGWLVYHYGEWGYRDGIGWFWVPGDTWSPARVEWDTWGDYSAWAPIPPDGMSWSEPWADHDSRAWTVVKLKDFGRENIGRYRVGSRPDAPHMDRAHDFGHQPDLGVVRQHTSNKVAVVKNETRPVHMGQRDYKRMNLHAEQQKVVARHERTVKKKVLVSRGEYHQRVDRERAAHRSHAEAPRAQQRHESGGHSHPSSEGGAHHRR
jgi:hypothetical protein